MDPADEPVQARLDGWDPNIRFVDAALDEAEEAFNSSIATKEQVLSVSASKGIRSSANRIDRIHTNGFVIAPERLGQSISSFVGGTVDEFRDCGHDFYCGHGVYCGPYWRTSMSIRFRVGCFLRNENHADVYVVYEQDFLSCITLEMRVYKLSGLSAKAYKYRVRNMERFDSKPSSLYFISAKDLNCIIYSPNAAFGPHAIKEVPALANIAQQRKAEFLGGAASSRATEEEHDEQSHSRPGKTMEQRERARIKQRQRRREKRAQRTQAFSET